MPQNLINQQYITNTVINQQTLQKRNDEFYPGTTRAVCICLEKLYYSYYNRLLSQIVTDRRGFPSIAYKILTAATVYRVQG